MCRKVRNFQFKEKKNKRLFVFLDKKIKKKNLQKKRESFSNTPEFLQKINEECLKAMLQEQKLAK